MNQNDTITLPDGGSVRLVSISGDDAKIDARARASFVGADEEKRTPAQIESLVRHLMRKRHTSPFEFVIIEFAIHCPLFVFNQLVRHRTASINAASGRYGALTPMPILAPPVDRCKAQGASKQKSGTTQCKDPEQAQQKIINHGDASKELQRDLLNTHGMSEEMARVVLPQNQSTQFFFQLNLHNLFHFFSLRANMTLDSHAQEYTADYARAMADLVRPHVPVAWAAWEDYVANAVTLNARELEYLAPALIQAMRDAAEPLQQSLNKGEFSDFIHKLEFLERRFV